MYRHEWPARAFLKIMSFCNYRNYKNKRRYTDETAGSPGLVFYDHDCPVCRAEMRRLKALDRANRLQLVNIRDPGFSEQYWRVGLAEFSQAMHVLTGKRIWLVGMPAIRYLYAQAGRGFLLAPSAWPLFAPLADYAYRKFASHRFAVSRWLGMAGVKGFCNDGLCAFDTKNRSNTK